MTKVTKVTKRNEIATTDENAKKVRTLLRAQSRQIHVALAGAMDTEKFVRVALTAFAKGDDKLASAHPLSVLSAVISAAQLGLSVDPLVGEAYLVSRWNKHRGCQWAQLMIGYQGLLKRSRMSGEIAYFDAGVVYVGDELDVRLGTDPHITHVRITDLAIAEEPEIIASYAIAHFRGEEQYKRVYLCPRWEIDKARARSESGEWGPWKTDYAAMAQKTALRRLLKICPMDEKTQAAIAREEAEEVGEVIDLDLDGGVAQEVADLEETSNPRTIEELKARTRENPQ